MAAIWLPAPTLNQYTKFRANGLWSDKDGTPVDLTGYAAKMQIRCTPSSDIVELELSTANGAIVLGGAAGTIVFTVDLTSETGTVLPEGSYVYDFLLVSPDDMTTKLFEGSYYVSKGITQL